MERGEEIDEEESEHLNSAVHVSVQTDASVSCSLPQWKIRNLVVLICILLYSKKIAGHYSVVNITIVSTALKHLVQCQAPVAQCIEEVQEKGCVVEPRSLRLA